MRSEQPGRRLASGAPLGFNTARARANAVRETVITVRQRVLATALLLVVQNRRLVGEDDAPRWVFDAFDHLSPSERERVLDDVLRKSAFPWSPEVSHDATTNGSALAHLVTTVDDAGSGA